MNNRHPTMYSNLYQALTQEIISGTLHYGDRLPSVKHLCSQYNVGIRTATDVLNAMRTEGYIKTEKRKRAIVIYKKKKENDLEPVFQLFNQQYATIEMQTILQYLSPRLFAFATSLQSEESISAMRKVIRGVNSSPVRKQLRLVYEMVQELLATCENPLILDFYVGANRISAQTIIDEQIHPFMTFFNDAEKKLKEFIDRVSEKDIQAVEKTTKIIYRRLHSSISAYYQAMSAAYPEYRDTPQSPFTWYTKRASSCAYLSIARQLIDSIRCGQYSDGSILPSIATLAKTHNVSQQTVHRALIVLRNLGFILTKNGVGSYVSLGKNEDAKISIVDVNLKEDAFSYLCSLQFIALTCKSALKITFGSLQESLVSEIEQIVAKQQGLFMFDEIWQAVIRAQPGSVMEAIYGQINSIIGWNSYFANLPLYATKNTIANQKCVGLVDYLRTGKRDAFAEAMEEGFRYTFFTIKKALLSLGVHDATRLTL